jgi:Trk-type K+ transport system membrane component
MGIAMSITAFPVLAHCARGIHKTRLEQLLLHVPLLTILRLVCLLAVVIAIVKLVILLVLYM